MSRQPSRIAAEKTVAKLKALTYYIEAPAPTGVPYDLVAPSTTLVIMVEKLEEFASHNQTGDQSDDAMMWDFVRKAAEQAIADVKALAVKLKYDIF